MNYNRLYTERGADKKKTYILRNNRVIITNKNPLNLKNAFNLNDNPISKYQPCGLVNE